MDVTFEYTDADAVKFITENDSLCDALQGALFAIFEYHTIMTLMSRPLDDSPLAIHSKPKLSTNTAVSVPIVPDKLLVISPFTTLTVTGGAIGKSFLEAEGELVFTEPSSAAGGLVHHRLKLSVPTVILTYPTLEEPEDEEDEADVSEVSTDCNSASSEHLPIRVGGD